MAVPFKQVQLKAIMKLSISEACKQLPALVRKVRRATGARVEITVHDEVVAERQMKNLRKPLLGLSDSRIFSYTSPVKSFQRHNGQLSTLETVLRLKGLFRHRLHPLGISPLQASVLLYLERHPQCEVKEIASALCIPNLSAVETVQRMRRNGWIRKPRIIANRKIVRLQLTKKGTGFSQKIKENIELIDKLFALADSRKVA